MSDNPYQPPPIHAKPPVHGLAKESTTQLWRKANLLVMEKNAQLPARCVKSGEPTDRTLKRALSWHQPWIFVTIIISIWIYVILALILRKQATIHVGLSDEWFAKRLRAILIGWLSVLVGIALIVAGIAFADMYGELYAWLAAVGAVVFIAGAIYGLLRARMVAAARISDHHVWLKGVCPDFLEGLPQWPYTP